MYLFNSEPGFSLSGKIRECFTECITALSSVTYVGGGEWSMALLPGAQNLALNLLIEVNFKENVKWQ